MEVELQMVGRRLVCLQSDALCEISSKNLARTMSCDTTNKLLIVHLCSQCSRYQLYQLYIPSEVFLHLSFDWLLPVRGEYGDTVITEGKLIIFILTEHRHYFGNTISATYLQKHSIAPERGHGVVRFLLSSFATCIIWPSR